MNRRSFFRLGAGIAGAAAVAPRTLLEPVEALYDCDKATAARWLASLGKPIEVVSSCTSFNGFVDAIRLLSGGWFEVNQLGMHSYEVRAPASKISAIRGWLRYYQPIGLMVEVREMRFVVGDAVVSL
jgi:hypothetical protein